MVQLKVYKNTRKLQEEQWFLDLYDSEPIKLTISIEDITNADATSVFSKTFKVPATAHNNDFFKNAFLIDGIDFDVTKKKPAEILVDGSEFRQGHIRLEKIYVNEEADQIDYEIIFLGETRDFSSRISDKTMCQLVMPDLNHTINRTNIEQSWLAYPESPSLTAGLAQGNVIYPLIDFGNNYSDTGVALEGRIALEGPNNFTTASHGLKPERWKPMIRAKRLIDQIFEDAGYTFESNFLNSNLFKQQYVSAFGNNAKVELEVPSVNSTDLLTVTDNSNDLGGQLPSGSAYILRYNETIYDPGNNYESSFIGNYYTCPATGAYTVRCEVLATTYVENSDYSNIQGDHAAVIYRTTGANVILSTFTSSYTSGNTTAILETTFNANAGDRIYTAIDFASAEAIINQRLFAVVAAPGLAQVSTNLDCTYKQVDFIKDILTMYRLVMSPSNSRPNHFIIEPWVNYVNTGDLYDWTDKMVRNKDVVIEPLFNTQSNKIEYNFVEDGDYINNYHLRSYKHIYGWLQYVSNNELLKGTREIKLNSIAPTPIANIEHTTQTAGAQFVIPQIHTHDQGETGSSKHLPIRPKTRLLFYNGLNDITNNDGFWHWYQDNIKQSKYALVTPYQNWPQTTTSLNLNWYDDVGYWDQGALPKVNTPTLFNNYWQSYVSSLYNKFARRLTAYFVLNNVDLQNFSFDDTIFVDGVYYTPEKIIDVQIGERTEVKVQLIKSPPEYKPNYVDEPLTGFSLEFIAPQCAGTASGQIIVNTNGTPNFSWNTDGGLSGTHTALIGQAPYTFNIQNVPAGTHQVTVIDSVGRIGIGTIVVPTSINAPVTSTVVKTAANCPTCDGTINVTPSGGVGPYIITWQDQGSGFTRTGLCEGNYAYFVTDLEGCQSVTSNVTIECGNTPTYVYEYGLLSQDCQTLTPQQDKISSIAPIQSGDIFKVSHKPGCYQIIALTTGVAAGQPTQFYATCESCNGNQPPLEYQYELLSLDSNCTDTIVPNYRITSPGPLTVGDFISINETIVGIEIPCYQVGQQLQTATCGVTFNCVTVLQFWRNCETCVGAPPELFHYFAAPCDGISESITIRIGDGSFGVPIGSTVFVTELNKCFFTIEVATGSVYSVPVEDVYADCASCNPLNPEVCTVWQISNDGPAPISWSGLECVTQNVIGGTIAGFDTILTGCVIDGTLEWTGAPTISIAAIC